VLTSPDVTVAPSSPTWHTVLDIVGDLLAKLLSTQDQLLSGTTSPINHCILFHLPTPDRT